MKTDVLIIGGGPGGAAAAMFLLREGIVPLILEQEEFPRFHIGESLTGEAAQVLRRLGLKEKMEQMENPVKHGVAVYLRVHRVDGSRKSVVGHLRDLPEKKLGIEL